MQLVKKVEEYRVNTEEEATALIETFKNDQCAGGYEVIKSGYTFKTKKSKGEIVDSWYIVSVTMNYNIGE